MTALATERYRLLIDLLGEEDGKSHGWKKRVAERLGVHPSYVSRILSGQKLQVGRDVIERACRNIGIAPEFFTNRVEGDVKLEDFAIIDTGPAVESLQQKLGRRVSEDVTRTWDDAIVAAMDFLDAAVRDRDEDAARRRAEQLLAAVEEIPTAQAARELRRALEAEEPTDAVLLAAFRVANALGVDFAVGRHVK